jgi:CheY-like chemotaxis protein
MRIAASSAASAVGAEGGDLSLGVRKRTAARMKGDQERSLILVVDDDRDNREMYRHYLEWVGFRVVEAVNGLEAFERASALNPAVIVTDLALPRLDGWEAARRLKANPGTRHIPILAISAHAYGDDVARAYAAGCDVYLPKPCLPEDLARKIRTILKRVGTASKATRANGRRPVVAVPPSEHADASPGGRGKALETAGPRGDRAAPGSGRREPARLDRRSR